MNELAKVFNYEATEVRTFLVDGQPWFVAKDICNILDIKNATDSLKNLDQDDLDTTEVIDSLGRPQITNIVNESGLYQLIFQSRKPEAKNFKRWVTHEVLPSIRKTGTYSVENIFENPDALMQILANYSKEKRLRISAENKLKNYTPSNISTERKSRRIVGEKASKKAAAEKAVEMYLNDTQYSTAEIVLMCGITKTTLYTYLKKNASVF